jgi:hypothetical protein
MINLETAPKRKQAATVRQDQAKLQGRSHDRGPRILADVF